MGQPNPWTTLVVTEHLIDLNTYRNKLCLHIVDIVDYIIRVVHNTRLRYD